MLPHLRVHSHFSFFQATASPEELVRQAARDGLSAIALTDRDGLHGSVEFSRNCEDVGILPIIGLTLRYHTPDLERTHLQDKPAIAVLLAKDEKGFRSLSRLSSLIMKRRWQEGTSKASLFWEEIQDCQDGIFFLEAGSSGHLFQLAGQEDLRAAKIYLSKLAGLYEDRCAIGVQISDLEDHSKLDEVISTARQFGIPSVAAQPIYSLQHDECALLPTLYAIGSNCRLDRVPADEVRCDRDRSPKHWLSQNEFTQAFSSYPDLLANLESLPADFQASLPIERTIWPSLELIVGSTPESELRERAREEFEKRYSDGDSAAVKDRFKYELKAINEHGYAPLFLLVSDIAAFAREEGIPINTRGSVANSLVAYLMGISDVDPVAHDLLFERFLNPARSDLPDIDLDFCSRRRDEVLEYIRDKYGLENVAQVATINTLQVRSAVRETAKAHGFDESSIRRMTKDLPRFWRPSPHRNRLDGLEGVRNNVRNEAEREVLKIASRLIGQPDHVSVHPGGVVITPGPVSEYIPVQHSPAGHQLTQFDHQDLSFLKIPKIDLLGVRALTVLAEAIELVNTHHLGEYENIKGIQEDRRTSDLLSQAETIGVFQCESQGARRTLRQLNAKNIQDLAIANAFFKPGPAMGGMARSFIRRFRGEEEAE